MSCKDQNGFSILPFRMKNYPMTHYISYLER